MARFIDADELLNNLPDDLPYKASVKRVLIQAPKTEIIECKDCKHRYTPFCALWYGMCNGAEYFVEHGEDFSCSWGESEE